MAPVRTLLTGSVFAACLACSGVALADDEPPPITADQAKAAIDGPKKDDSLLPEAPPEAPPPPPRHKGFVLEQSLGAMGWLGKFKDVAHPAFYLHTQFGFEIFKFLMAFAEGELGYTDTSNGTDPSKTRAFPIFGFGGGVRFTVKPTDRFGIFLQGSVGAAEADVPTRTLQNFGFRDAEVLGLYFGGRLGLEWYQIDRHMALGVQGGARLMQGFKRVVGTDTPLAWDGALALRYTF